MGILSAFFFGIYLIDVKNTAQLIFIDGPSISVVTEKFDFKQNEKIKIRIVNSGTVPLNFSDTSYGLRITGLSGILMYSPPALTTISSLDPGDEVEFSWNQVKDDGDKALEGLYKISVQGKDDEENKIEKSATITIWK